MSRYRTDLITRRQALGILGAASLVGSSSANSASSSSAASLSASCVLIPQETQGPYPLFKDTAGMANYMRKDITEGRAGIPLNLLLTILNVNNRCLPIADALVYVWQCDKDGVYSGYRQSGANAVGETFCRGAQMTDGNGQVRFTTIYPGWFPGRITHIHFRVYLGKTLEATSQLTFPPDITTAVYSTPLYAARGQNTSIGSFAADSEFSDGVQYQLCSTSRNAATGGYDASLGVGVAL